MNSDGPPAAAYHGRHGRGGAAAAPAGVMSFEDGVLYSVEESPDWGGFSSAAAAKPQVNDVVAAAASGGGDGRSSRRGGVGAGGIKGRAGRGQQQHGLVADDPEQQQQLHVLYRSLSTRQGSWR